MASYQDLTEEAIHAIAIEAAELNLIRTLSLKPYKDGNMWCFLFGEDLQSGVAGFGKIVKEIVRTLGHYPIADLSGDLVKQVLDATRVKYVD